MFALSVTLTTRADVCSFCHSVPIFPSASRMRSPRIRHSWRGAELFRLALSLALIIAAAAHGQTSPPNPSPVRCPHPANPHLLHFECVGEAFDFIQDTLTQDWVGFRTELSRLGITPIASYTSQFMGNPSGGQSRGFTYSGTLQASINWDLQRLLGTPGLSFNVGGAWSTGKNLSADYVGNSFAVQSAYSAPGNGTNNLTLGQIYLQQQLFNNSLLIAAGRLALEAITHKAVAKTII
jgi:Carbohydrate-selective porin, OprB family